MTKEKKLAPTSLRLDPDMKAALERLAADDDRSLSSYITRVLREHVARSAARKPTKGR